MAAKVNQKLLPSSHDTLASDTPDWRRLYLEERDKRLHLQSIVSGLGDGLVLFDADLRFLYVNEYTLAIMGRTAEEVLGQSFFTLYPDADTTPFGIGLRTALREKRKVEADTFRPQNGRWWRSFIYPTEEGVTVYYRDITHLKTAEAERSRLASIVESSEDAIISKTLDGIITSWNAAAERIFGYAAAEVIGKPMLLIFPPDRPDEENDILERIRRGERIEHSENIRIHKDGSRIDVSLTISPLRDDAGAIVGVSTIARDISEQKRYRREHEYVMASANCLLWYADVQESGQEYLLWTRHLVDEEAAQRFLPLDLQPEEHYMHAWYRCRVLEDRDRCDRQGIAALRAGRSYEQEFRCVAADGSVHWLHENVHIETLEPGKHWRVAAVAIDITERKRGEEEKQRAETARREAEALLQAVLDNSPAAIYVKDLEGRFLLVNAVFESMYHVRRAEIVGKTNFDFLPKDMAETVRANDQAVIEAGRPIATEETVLFQDGLHTYLSVKFPLLNAIGQLVATGGISTDITDRKMAEAELRARETQFRAIFENTAVGVALVTTEGRISECNPAFQQMLGYSASELIHRSYLEITHPDDVEADAALAHEVLSGQRDTYAIEKRYLRKDGAILWGHLSISAIRDTQGDIRFVVAVINDISAQKEAETERARQAQEREYVMAVAHCQLWYADVYNTDHPDYLDWHVHITDEEAAQRFLPLDVKEGEPYDDARYRHRLPEDREVCDRLGTTSIRAGKSYVQEFRCRCADGTLRWLREDIQVETVEADTHWRVVAVCIDITEQKRLEQQFLQAQKMEGIGRLAGGIAHDFNNLLSVILGYAEMVEIELSEDSNLLPNIQNIQTAATRAAKLTAQLLAFARKQVSEARVLNLNDLIRDIRPMLKPLIREDIELVTLLNKETGNVKADSHQVEQVIVNLVVNARDALPQGGKILIQTSNVVLADHYLREQTTVQPGEYVLLAISDTGTGMTAEVKGRLFEPFFTTKEVGKGTGLGLATVYGIVKQSGGYIFVYSEEGFGTTVKVYLPRVDRRVQAKNDEAKVLASLWGEETVLVVEDESLVRELTVSTLQRNGYRVLQAENGEEALKVVQAFAEHIHLVVTDAIMPVMGGKELADRLKEVRPATQVLYVSGYTAEVTSIQGILPEGTAFLQKPFTAQALLSKVHEAVKKGR
jgi:two-component system, cell cycle sensor histidine kinase and response regulator CckA